MTITNPLRENPRKNGENKPRFRAALIDMDGTIYDSMPGHTWAWHRLMTELGIPTVRDDFYLYEGMTGRQTINRLFLEHLHREATAEEVEELYRRKTVYFNEYPKAQPIPGAAQFLNRLKEAGIMRVLVTGSGQRTLIDRLENDFPGIFSPEMMITSRDVEHGKPSPEPYLKGMLKASVEASEAVVIENAPIGVTSGKASGAYTIGLTTGPIPPGNLLDAGADLVLPSMEALVKSFDHIFLTIN